MFFNFVSLQLLASGLLVLLQLSIIPVFLAFHELRKRILYRIMLSIALSDFLQLFAIFQFTLYEQLGWQYNELVEKFASGVYIIAWDHLIVQHFLLAINRLIIIVRAYYSPNSHKQESPLENVIFNFLLLLSWLIMAILLVLFMTPLCGGVWDSEAVGFFYNTSLECSDIYRNIELYFTIAFPAICVCCYVAIIWLLRKARNIGIGKQAENGGGKLKLNNQEKRILIISVILFAIITALILAWYIDYTKPPWTLLFCGYLLINSGLTLIMNSEYQKYCLRMWHAILHFLMPCWVDKREKKQQQQQANRVIDLRSHPQQKTSSSTNNNLNNLNLQPRALFVRRSEQKQTQEAR